MRASLNISLPEEMRTWIEAEVSRGGYGTTSEYFRELVRDAQRRKLHDEIDSKLLAALEGGDPIPVTPEWWDERLRALKRRRKHRKRST